MPSISQMQALETDADYAGLGIGKSGGMNLPEVETVMYKAADKFLKLALARINQRRKVDTGNLSKIVLSKIDKTGGIYELTIGYDESNPASKYYDYQNKGVKGLDSNRPNSEYEFKTYAVSKNMVKAIMQWYLRHQNYIKNEDQKVGLKGLQKKRKSIAQVADKAKSLKKLAKNTAKNIKKRGLPRIGFFEDNIDKAFGDDFKQKLAMALGKDVALNIKQTFNGNTSNSK